MNNHTSSLEFSHFPVMLNEVLKITSPFNGGKYIDCTFGGGGYSREILKIPKTEIVAIDRDNNIKSIAEELERKFPKRFKFYQMKFSQLDTISENYVDAIIFDLGLSSIQLNNLERGFSFKSNKQLDMAMGLNNISAMEAVNNLSEQDLKMIIKFLGDEKEATRIARNIVNTRKKNKITKTNQLVKIIEGSKRKNFSKKINPCTKTFQALRIFVNKEISELISGIINATKKLKPGGKILVVTFHSIEDKIVKYFFNNFSKNKSRSSRYIPENKIEQVYLFEEYKNKVLKPSKRELEINNRARSAKLRFAIRSNTDFQYPDELINKFKNYLELETANV